MDPGAPVTAEAKRFLPGGYVPEMDIAAGGIDNRERAAIRVPADVIGRLLLGQFQAYPAGLQVHDTHATGTGHGDLRLARMKGHIHFVNRVRSRDVFDALQALSGLESKQVHMSLRADHRTPAAVGADVEMRYPGLVQDRRGRRTGEVPAL